VLRLFLLCLLPPSSSSFSSFLHLFFCYFLARSPTSILFLYVRFSPVPLLTFLPPLFSSVVLILPPHSVLQYSHVHSICSALRSFSSHKHNSSYEPIKNTSLWALLIYVFKKSPFTYDSVTKMYANQGHNKLLMHLYHTVALSYDLKHARILPCGPGTVVRIAIGYGLDGPGIETRWGVRFSAPVQTGPRSPPSLLYNGYRVFPGGKERPGRDADTSPPSSAIGHERVEVYIYCPYGPYGLYRASVHVQRCTLPDYFHKVCAKEKATSS